MLSSKWIHSLAKHLMEKYKNRKHKGIEFPLIKHLHSLILITIGEGAAEGADVLLLGNIMTACMIVLFTYSKVGVVYACLYGVGVLLVPYMILRIRMFSIRVESSYEGEFLITELINQYKLNHFNMVEAIEATVKYVKDSPRSKKMLFIMSIKIKSYKDKDELHEILDGFTYAINTEWSRMLANNLMLAIEEGFEVTSGLLDIQNELKRAKSAYEKSERNTSEGFIMVKLVLPILYCLTVYLSVKHFGFTIGKFAQYQMLTSTGIKMFMMNLFLYLLNVLLMIVFKKRKFDIT